MSSAFPVDSVIMAFCIKPNFFSLHNYKQEYCLFRRPFSISTTTHLSKSVLCAAIPKIKNGGACQEIRISGWGCDRQKTAAFRSGEEEKRMKAFEQEGLIDDGDLESRVVDGDGLEATLNRLSKWLVSCVFCAIVILRHDGEAMWLLSGSVLNTILSTVLKQVLNQDRPGTTIKSDPGMPSSHAQAIFFLAAYIIFSIVESLGVNALTLFVSSLVFVVASYLSWLRVSQQYHTVSQVLVGGILGSAFSIFWIWLWNAAIHEAYISHLLVRVCVALGAAGFSFAFALHVIRHWLKHDN